MGERRQERQQVEHSFHITTSSDVYWSRRVILPYPIRAEIFLHGMLVETGGATLVS